MQNLPIKQFLFFILGFFTLSCASYKDKFTQVAKTETTFTPQFLKEEVEQVFKVDIEVYGHQLGGVLAIKKLEPQHYRIALITEIGVKLLDFELINEEMKLNYAIEQLNKKIILNVLKQDFLILLNEQIKVNSQYTDADNYIYSSVFEGKKLYYFINTVNNQLDKIVLASNTKEKTIVTYKYENKFPNIMIDHRNIKLKINLHSLDN